MIKLLSNNLRQLFKFAISKTKNKKISKSELFIERKATWQRRMKVNKTANINFLQILLKVLRIYQEQGYNCDKRAVLVKVLQSNIC